MLRVNLLQLLLVAALLLCGVFATAQAIENDGVQRESKSLQDVLSDINVNNIHDALHALSDKFKDGIFPTDISAAEALQAEDEKIASFLRVIKRDSNVTASSEPVQQTTSVPSANPTTTSAAATTTEPTTSSEPTTSTEPSTTPSTTTEPSSSSVPSTTTEPTTTSTTSSPISTSSTSSTSAPTTSSVPSTLSKTTSSSSTSSSSTTTTSHSTTSTNTSLSTSTYKSTSTLPDGSLSTITSVTVVHVTPTGNAATTTTAHPGLQTGAAALTTAGLTREVVAMVGGAVLVAMAL